MKKRYTYTAYKLLLPLLFLGYIGSNIFFTHSHIVNGAIYIHNHPYKKGASEKHSHNASEMLAFDLFAHTSFSDYIYDHYSFKVIQPLLQCYIESKLNEIFYVEKIQNVLLRAPPSL